LERLSHPADVAQVGRAGPGGLAALGANGQETCAMSVLVKTATLYADLAHTPSSRSCGCKWTSDKMKATRFPDAGKAANEMVRRSVTDFSIENDNARFSFAA
jgi:hypothetical protein